MSLSHDDLSSYDIDFQVNTPGGGTYYLDGWPICLASLRTDEEKDTYCSRKAGWGTSHPGTGRCKHHGGRAGEGILTTRYSSWTKSRLREQFESFITDPDLLDLGPELAVQRTILKEAILAYEKEHDWEKLRFANQILDGIGHTIERIEKIQSTHVLTAATARYLILQGMEVAKRFIPDGQVFEFVEAWRTEVKGALTGPSQLDGDR